MSTPQIGSSFGHYRIDSVLGVGGMGMVYSATDLRLGRQVAVKVVLGHFASSPQFLARFQHEAAVLARLDSPHVISIYDHGEQDGWPYIVTQYAAGGDLGRLIRARGSLPPDLAFTAVAQVADALSAAHAVGVIHRDVKPANVLLRDDRIDRLHVYLCDFGVAHTETSGLTSPGAVAGTWNYLAPERAEGESGSPASDIYSAGCLLYETLTGRPPYVGADVEVAMAHLQEPVPQLPGEDDLTRHVNEVLARSLAKHPDDRYATAADLRTALRGLAGGFTPSTPQAPPLVLGRRRQRQRVARVSGAALALAIGATFAAVALWPDGRGEPNPDPTTAPTTAPTAPTLAPPPTSTPVVPDPEPLVTGDLDGDGLGDLATVAYGGGWGLYSTGESFGAPKKLPQITFKAVSGDMDGDGRLDIVTITGETPSFNVTVHPATGEARSTLIQTATVGDFFDTTPMLGDFDGDGLGDIALAGVGGGRLSVSVALTRADGSLARAEVWFTSSSAGDLNDGNQFALGDVTGDGLVDVVQVIEADNEPVRIRLLSSTGTALTQVGRAQRVADEGETYGDWKAGDFDGDGTVEVAHIDDGPAVTVWSWESTRFSSTIWADDPYGELYFRHVSVTDVDGDGDDDLAGPTSDTGLRILESSGNSFRVVPGKGRVVAPEKYAEGMLDPVEWLGY